MELHRKIVDVNSRQINIRPFGDLQMGEKTFRPDLWKRWKQEALKDRTSLFIGMGDYSDSFRPTIQKRLASVFLDDPSALSQHEKPFIEQMAAFAEELKPFKNRIIGLHSGHHQMYLQSGINTTQYLCQLLGVKYLGFEAMTQLVLRRTGGASCSIDIYSTHGCGGSGNTHSDLAKFQKILSGWNADIYMRGHSSRVYCVDGDPAYYLTNTNGALSLRKKKRLIVNTGSFMEGRKEGVETYVELAGMAPLTLGWCVVNLHMSDNQEEPLRINGRAETE